jgi:tripartite-type tricarboxylate transporter receptor subunit TctC
MYRTLKTTVLASLVTAAVATGAQAQTKYPEKPVSIVVTFSPGGTTDSTTRVFAEELTKRNGQQFLVENLPGANGSVGTAKASTARADGYQLVVGSPNTLIQNPYLYGDTGYTLESFTPVARLAVMDFIVVTRPALGIKTLQDLVKYSRDNPGKLNFGSAGIGNTAHQAGELFKLRTGADITHIPYQGGALATAALLAGEVDVLFNTATEVLPYISSGDAVALAVMSPERIPFLPDVPTIAEEGVKDATVAAWNGLFAPAGTPSDVVDFLNAEVSEILKDETVQKRLFDLGLRPTNPSAAELAEELEGEKPAMIELIDLTGGPQK